MNNSTSDLYIKRTLTSDSNTYAEDELVEAADYIVVLAEPGAGKTELLKSLANQLKVKRISANRLVNSQQVHCEEVLVIDAFDELAQTNHCGIYQLLDKIDELKPKKLVISSRSSEWGDGHQHAFEEYFEFQPLVVRLSEFNEAEQQLLFYSHLPNESFEAFYDEVQRFNLDVLLPNPQFLGMFANAYIESNRKFANKKSIFEKAVERLAKESRPSINNHLVSSLPLSKKISITSEIFAGILLSGSEGISVSGHAEEKLFPNINSLHAHQENIKHIIDSKLFKPSDNMDQHMPVHKVISEYCAARHLVQKITEDHEPLTLRVCLTVIAANGYVRDELRGMVGWMATLGSQSIQRELIELDPYAILANGDPSQLVPSSKKYLLTRLQQVEVRDPYFRRSDFWRQFSTVDFFDIGMAEHLRPLLKSNSGGDLRDLVLEIIKNSTVVDLLTSELTQIVLDSDEDLNSKSLAIRCLCSSPSFDYMSLFERLIAAKGHSQLDVIVKGISVVGVKAISFDFLLRYLKACAQSYPTDREKPFISFTHASRYYIQLFIKSFERETTERLLDSLTQGLACNCGKEFYECYCREGVSKIVGRLLDHYFEVTNPPYDPKRIWSWVKDLNFHANCSENESQSVKALKELTDLRRSIFIYLFEPLASAKECHALQSKLDSHSGLHSGLHLYAEDVDFLIDHAFETNNTELWSIFIVRHHFRWKKDKRRDDNFRQKMRRQANENTKFMAKWAESKRAEQQFKRDVRKRYGKSERKHGAYEKHRNAERIKTIKYIADNQELIASGQDFGLLQDFAYYFLNEPKQIPIEFGNEQVVHNSIRNCLSSLTPHIPSLKKLAATSARFNLEIVLYAFCIQTVREQGCLDSIPNQVLTTVRTDLSMHHSAVSDEEREYLKREIDRLLFPDLPSKEAYLRDYIEPQLRDSKREHPEIEVLRHDDTFSEFRASLPFKWLSYYTGQSIYTQDILFDLVAQHGNRVKLNQLIFSRSTDWAARQNSSKLTDNELEQCKFWYVRAFFFLEINVAKPFFDALVTDKDSIFLFESISGSLVRRFDDGWPMLTSDKVYELFNAFFESWPKVPLPSGWGSDSPKEEKAYRYLVDSLRCISADSHTRALDFIEKFLNDERFADLHQSLKNIQVYHLRNKALLEFTPPTPENVVNVLSKCNVVTVEGLRKLVLHELECYQKEINGGEYNTANRFYKTISSDTVVHHDEVRCVEIIAEYLKLKLEKHNVNLETEDQTKDQNRIDLSASKMINGQRKLLVIEAKGQWHKEIYTAINTQLVERYTIHPDACEQGIYVVIWFGPNEKVAGLKRHNINSSQELKDELTKSLSENLKSFIDIFVLDVSKPGK